MMEFLGALFGVAAVLALFAGSRAETPKGILGSIGVFVLLIAGVFISAALA